MKVKVISAQKLGDCELVTEDGQKFYLNLRGRSLRANDELELVVPEIAKPAEAPPVEAEPEDEPDEVEPAEG